MKAFYIDPKGIVRYNEFPEDRWGHGCTDEGHCSQDSIAFCEQFCGCYNNYQQALQAAKDSSAECADQNYASMIIANVMLAEPDIRKYGRPQGGDYGFLIEKNTVYPFPSEQYEVEVKWCRLEMKPPNDAGKRYRNWGDRAFITPKKEPMKQGTKTPEEILTEKGVQFPASRSPRDYNLTLIAMKEYTEQFNGCSPTACGCKTIDDCPNNPDKIAAISWSATAVPKNLMKKEFIQYYVDRREQQGMLSSLAQMFDTYVVPLQSKLSSLESENTHLRSLIKGYEALDNKLREV